MTLLMREQEIWEEAEEKGIEKGREEEREEGIRGLVTVLNLSFRLFFSLQSFL